MEKCDIRSVLSQGFAAFLGAVRIKPDIWSPTLT